MFSTLVLSMFTRRRYSDPPRPEYFLLFSRLVPVGRSVWSTLWAVRRCNQAGNGLQFLPWITANTLIDYNLLKSNGSLAIPKSVVERVTYFSVSSIHWNNIHNYNSELQLTGYTYIGRNLQRKLCNPPLINIQPRNVEGLLISLCLI